MTRHSRMTSREATAAAFVVALALAGLSQTGSGTKHPEAAGLTENPAAMAGSAYTPQSWAGALLAAAHLPVTTCNLAAFQSWEVAEGGAWQNTATANPLNSTMPEPGSHAINADGVQAYTSWRQGLRATIATLGNGDYPGVVAALRSGGNAQAVADAVSASPWGTSAFDASC